MIPTNISEHMFLTAMRLLHHIKLFIYVLCTDYLC